jgi:hypothetical protein
MFQRNNLWVVVNDNFVFVPAERFMQIAAQGVPLERHAHLLSHSTHKMFRWNKIIIFRTLLPGFPLFEGKEAHK